MALGVAMGKMVGDAGYCVGSDMDVSDVLQDDDPYLEDEWRY